MTKVDVLEAMLKKISVGSKTAELCINADNMIYEKLNDVYNKKPTFKGLAFPTCISVNEICAYFSPLPEDSTTIKEGDLVKIELGVHIDGFPAFVGHTLVVKSDAKEPVVGEKAQVVLAAYNAAQAAVRKFTPGTTNTEITNIVEKVCNAYDVNAVEGALSHELKKHLIDGNKVIINKMTFDQKVQEEEISIHDVFAFEVLVSSGKGKPKEADVRTTVYKRMMDQSYNLKLKQSRTFFN